MNQSHAYIKINVWTVKVGLRRMAMKNKFSLFFVVVDAKTVTMQYCHGIHFFTVYGVKAKWPK